MFAFTKQESSVLITFVLVLFSGSVLQYAFKKYPDLKDAVNLADSERIYRKIDINTAGFDELVDIPYIGEYTASNIIKYRQVKGPFTSLEQLKQVKGIRDKNYQKFFPYLKRVSKQ